MGKRIVVQNGDRYGRLVVIGEAESKGGYRRAKCECDCGNVKDVALRHLKAGLVKSCGCLAADSARTKKNFHGKVGTALYRRWSKMKGRCNNESSDHSKSYKARGITYTPEWETFQGFAKWAESSGYKDGLSLERDDVNGNYEPSNCRWIPVKEQQLNTRKSCRWHIDGTVYTTLKEAADSHNVCPKTIQRWCGRDKNRESREGCYATPVYS